MNRKHALGAAVAAVVITASLWAWREHSEGASPKASSSATCTQETDTEPSVTLTPEARDRGGIETAEARAAEAQAPAHAIATVLPLQELIDSASAIAAARAQAERTNAALEASRRDHERVKGLHAQERNASDRALEFAEAAWRADDASARAAAAALRAVQASARARWGAVLAEAMTTHGWRWMGLESGKQVLLRVTSVSGAVPVEMPASLDIELASKLPRKARLIAPSPSSDPRVQGPAFFYAMDSQGAAVGQTLHASFAVGPKEAGAVMPGESLLWWQGKQWVYVEEKPGQFERREAAGARRIDSGWFVPGFKSGKVVARGAQLLLSQEMRSAIKVGEDDK